MNELDAMAHDAGEIILSGVPEGFDALVLGDLARSRFRAGGQGATTHILHVGRDDHRLAALESALGFFARDVEVLTLPAWDCLPYDRISPNPVIASARLEGLRALEAGATRQPRITLTTVNAVLQRVPARESLRKAQWRLRPGQILDNNRLMTFLAGNGFERTDLVREAGEYAVRGGIIDIFPAGASHPVRLDLFGETLESIRTFDAGSQRSSGQLHELQLGAVNDIVLDKASISRFRRAYIRHFGVVRSSDPLYEAISSGRRYQGMEHWLPLFHEALDTVFDYAGDALVSMDDLTPAAVSDRLEQIADYYEARRAALKVSEFGAVTYKPLPPEMLYLTADDWQQYCDRRPVRRFTPFEILASENQKVTRLSGKLGRSFATERGEAGRNVFDAVSVHVRDLQRQGRKVAISCWSDGSADRMAAVLADHGLKRIRQLANWTELASLPRDTLGLCRVPLEHGFETPDFALISEQDILGDRLVRRRAPARKAEDILTEVASMSSGDLVVHIDHGIGRFEGLQTLTVTGAPHDCLEIIYHGGDKLFLPVENIELLSRYGADEGTVQLDRLGSAAWQARKSRMKKRLRDMADELIGIAAARQMRTAPRLEAPAGLYDEFAAAFPFEETEDQARAISAVLDDLVAGRPMDRLVCGDVGFGKTEVALRAAFVAVMEGKQVAVVVPTTLLARQHTRTFTERFRNVPVRIRQASRLVSARDMKLTREGLAAGEVDIVIGTHVLLGKNIRFHNLGLMIIDEEQHFGVRHKERLKALRADMHVLTLTATPIPRTLQLALSGVRELSLMASPPVDRLAVRTFISPFDPVVVRETLLREHYRGGQSFYVCPRISDLDEVREFLREHVPEIKVTVAHGRMAPARLEEIMTAFYDGRYDVLLSTTIVESGLDIPTANTLIIHRADMFGLAQLYQLRGRVGRSKLRAYALLTVPAKKPLTPAAEKRLKVLQSLDSLGAGFSLASHDLDLRGAGNLLGEEQSGHIREVGFELYQHMLEEAVSSLRAGDGEDEASEDDWSPQIATGAAVLLPDSYVPDLQIRLDLYRRLSELADEMAIEGFAAEMIDRFGPMPDEARALLKIMAIKIHCRHAGIEKLETGPRGVVITFRNNQFANPAGLVAQINEWGKWARLRPDHKLVVQRNWPDADERLKGSLSLARQLRRIAQSA